MAQNDGAPELIMAPDYFVLIAVGVLLFLVLAGIVIWWLIFSTSKTNFGQEFRKSESTAKAAPPPSQENELDVKAISKSAETVSNKEDVAVVDELRGRFASQQTVDAMGDLSVSTEDDDDDEDT